MEKLKGNKGAFTIIDVMVLGFIVVLATAYMLMFTLSHSSQRAKDMKYLAEDVYAENALRTLSYVTAQKAGYWTVQHDTLEEVSDKDLKSSLKHCSSSGLTGRKVT